MGFRFLGFWTESWSFGVCFKGLLCVTVKADDVRSGAREGTKGSRSEWSNVNSSFHARMSSAVVKDFLPSESLQITLCVSILVCFVVRIS